jgi:hypothetical protein
MPALRNLNHGKQKHLTGSRLRAGAPIHFNRSLLADEAGAALPAAAERVGGLLEDVQRPGDAVVAGEARDLAVGGEDVGHLVAGGAAHHGDLGARVHPGADVVRPVGLAQHAVHAGADGVELERYVEMREAVVRGETVPVDPRVLLGHGHRIGHDPEPPVEAHHHAVGRAGAEHGQRRRGGRAPAAALDGVERDGHAVEGDGEAVDGRIPGDRPPDADVQAVAAEANAQRLHPREVTRRLGVALADEVRVDVQVGVREQAEVGVPPAVEQELVAVAADEARVVALRPGQIAHCTTRHIKIFAQNKI